MSTEADYSSQQHSYHNVATAEYVLPNDSPEHVRLETQAAHLSAIMGNEIIHSPVEKSKAKHILDIGCGTGIVTYHLAQSFPEARVYGLDLSKVPELRSIPANVRFLQGDVLEQAPDQWQPKGALDQPTGFDLIYSRLLLCGMSDWPKFIRKEFSLLNSGGWVEVHDLDWVWYNEAGQRISDAWSWWQKVKVVGESRGLDFECGSKVKQWMHDAGLVDVEVTTYRWPYGGQWETSPEMKDMGDYVAKAMPEMVWHVIPKTLEGRDFSEGEIFEMQKEMHRDFAPEKGKHWIFYVTRGRKP